MCVSRVCCCFNFLRCFLCAWLYTCSVKISLDINRPFGVCLRGPLPASSLSPLQGPTRGPAKGGRLCLSPVQAGADAWSGRGAGYTYCSAGHRAPPPHHFHTSIAHLVWGTVHLVTCYDRGCFLLAMARKRMTETTMGQDWTSLLS